MAAHKSNTTLFQKIIYSLGGFLIGMLVIMLFLKIFSNVWGVILGTIINAGIFVYIYKNKAKHKEKVIIAYGILAAAIFTVIVGGGLWILVEITFNDIVS